jgi:hypothetical protein
MPTPRPVLSIPATIARLRTYIDPTHRDYWRVEQHANIRVAIAMYESVELDGWKDVTIMHGKVVGEEERFKDSSCYWIEVRGEILRFVEETWTNGCIGWDSFPVNLGEEES